MFTDTLSGAKEGFEKPQTRARLNSGLYWFAKFDEQPRWGLSVDVVVIHSFQLETLDPL